MPGQIIADIRAERRAHSIPKRFTGAQAARVLPRWHQAFASGFLAKHRLGNPRSNSVLFVQNHDGTYTLVEEAAIDDT